MSDKRSIPLDNSNEGEVSLNFDGSHVAELTVSDHRGRWLTVFASDDEIRSLAQALLDGIDTAGLRVENGVLIWPEDPAHE